MASFGNEIVGIRGGGYWRDLEPKKDVYHFSQIRQQLQNCKKYNKKFLFFLATRRFNSMNRPVPDYLYKNPIYNGGAEPFAPKRGSKGTGIGSMARIWDLQVLNRLHKLLKKLGEEFDSDPYFEGIIFGETACQASPNAYGLTQKTYTDGIKSILTVAKSAFPRSQVFQMVNWGRRDVIEGIIEHCYKIGAGISAPDLMPDRERFSHVRRPPSFDYFAKYAGKMPLSIEVQAEQYKGADGNLTPAGMFDMALNTLKVNYIIWGAFEVKRYKLSFSRDIQPFLKKQIRKPHSECPANISPCCR